MGDPDARARRPALRKVLYTRDGVILVVGLVLGAGIFRAPQLVAAGSTSGTMFLALWVAGGLVSLVGALCYAELAEAYPDAGGEYHFLSRALGRRAGFLCAWSRMTVIQTGSIAILSFLVGDYAASLVGGGAGGPGLSAAVAGGVVVGLTLLNVAGLRQSGRVQYTLTAVEVLGLMSVIVVGLFLAAPAAGPAVAAPAAEASAGGIALAMVFVLLTFGGWSEAAYISAELCERRGALRTFAWGLGIITALYLLANAAYLRGLGLAGVAGSSAVAADLLRGSLGAWGAATVSFAVMIAALSSANATMITGARSNYALGRDLPRFAFMGDWHEGQHTPRAAFLLQGGISLLLVGFGALARSGFEAMVAYTAPVFWLILFGTGAALMILRRKEPGVDRPFRVPLYPLVPLLFCGIAGFMLYSSIAYAGRGALLGVAVMLAGLPVLAVAGRRRVAARVAVPPAVVLALALGVPGGLAGQETPAPAREPDVHFVPTDTTKVREMLTAAAVDSRDLVYDLGCGDGRIVISAVKQYGARGVCVDIDPVRIKQSKSNADTAGVRSRIEFVEGDLFEQDLSRATVVTLYLLPSLNQRLRPKLFKELRPGTRVVSNAFDMGDWQADRTLNITTFSGMQTYAFLWIIPADLSGEWRLELKGGSRKGYTLDIKQKYQEVSGTAMSGGKTIPISNFSVKGDRLSFVLREGDSEAAGVTFEGTVAGDRITGVAKGSGGSGSWTAVRTRPGARPDLRPAEGGSW
jgi:amino acid transporter/SAM-dependent methyltransferase